MLCYPVLFYDQSSANQAPKILNLPNPATIVISMVLQFYDGKHSFGRGKRVLRGFNLLCNLLGHDSFTESVVESSVNILKMLGSTSSWGNSTLCLS